MLTQLFIQLISAKRIFGSYQDREIGMVVMGLGAAFDAMDSGHISKACPIGAVNLASSGKGLIDVFELEQAKGRVEFAHLAVDARGHYSGFVDKAEVLQIIDVLLGLGIGAHDRAALEGGEHLGGMEAQDGEVAMLEQAFTLVLDAKGMRRVINDLQVVVVGNGLNSLNVAGVAVHMDRQNGSGLWSDGGFDLVWVDVQCLGVNIHEHRLNAVPEQGMGCGNEGVRRGDHLAGNAQSLKRRDQCQGAVGEQGQMADTQIFAQGLLELLMKRPLVGQFPALPYLLQIRYEFLQGRKEGLGDVDGFVRHTVPLSCLREQDGFFLVDCEVPQIK